MDNRATAVRELPVEGFSMIGKTVSHYRIIEKLGNLTIPGVVYKAQDPSPGRFVALRFLPEAIPKERHALVRILEHPRSEAGSVPGLTIELTSPKILAP
ncbi:MAG: hypothetical protein JSU72_20515 [Deltaproteobacteria bacterium]|nr:MAG: hypothetical protein JSU72_20515 [Deltaproteobacteria bacterium]